MLDKLIPITAGGQSREAVAQRHGAVARAIARVDFDEPLGRGVESLQPVGLLIAARARRAGRPVMIMKAGLELLTGTDSFVEQRLEWATSFTFELFDAIPGLERPWALTSIEWGPKSVKLFCECTDSPAQRRVLWEVFTDLLEEILPKLPPSNARGRYSGKGAPPIDSVTAPSKGLPAVLHPFNYFGPGHLSQDARKWLSSLRDVRSVKSSKGWVLKVVEDPCAFPPKSFTSALSKSPGGVGYCTFPTSAPLEAEMPKEQRVARVRGMLETRYGHEPEHEELQLRGGPLISVLFWVSEEDELSTTVSTVGLSTVPMPMTGRRFEIELQFCGELKPAQRGRLVESLGKFLSQLFEDGEPLVPNEILTATPIFPFAAMERFFVSEENDVNNPSRLRPTSWLRLWPLLTAEAEPLRRTPHEKRRDELLSSIGTRVTGNASIPASSIKRRTARDAR